jgi:hypothetical protein
MLPKPLGILYGQFQGKIIKSFCPYWKTQLCAFGGVCLLVSQMYIMNLEETDHFEHLSDNTGEFRHFNNIANPGGMRHRGNVYIRAIGRLIIISSEIAGKGNTSSSTRLGSPKKISWLRMHTKPSTTWNDESY